MSKGLWSGAVGVGWARGAQTSRLLYSSRLLFSRAPTPCPPPPYKGPAVGLVIPGCQ